jgi:hypothetical protein
MAKKQSNAQQKKFQPLGFRTSDNFRANTFGQNPFKQAGGQKGFNKGTFKTQHKG